MKDQNIEDQLRRAVYAIEEEFQEPIALLLLLGAVPQGGGGFHLHQIGNVSLDTARTLLVAAIADIDAGKGEIKEKL